MKSCPRACNNRTTYENRQTGCEGSRLPFFSGWETPCGFLPALFRQFSPQICTIILHSFYTVNFMQIRVNKISNLKNLSHTLRMSCLASQTRCAVPPSELQATSPKVTAATQRANTSSSSA